MRLLRPNRRKHRVAQTQPVILFVVADCTFAIAASAVTEIQPLQDLTAIGSVGFRFGKVRHRITRDGRHYWVVDANFHFSMLPTQSSRVLMLADSPVAVKVDSIVRMAEMSKLLPLPRSFRGDERTWYLGLTLMQGSVIPVVNPASFLSDFEMHSLEASAEMRIASSESVGANA